MMEEGERPEDKSGGHVRRARRKRGGRAEEKVNTYNAEGSPAVEAAEDESPDFRKGGRTKRKDGGHAEGEAAKRRADREPRGRHREGGRTREDRDHEREREREKRDHEKGERERHARGGRAMGHSPYSSARSMTRPEQGGAAAGHEGGQKLTEDD